MSSNGWRENFYEKGLCGETLNVIEVKMPAFRNFIFNVFSILFFVFCQSLLKTS